MLKVKGSYDSNSRIFFFNTPIKIASDVELVGKQVKNDMSSFNDINIPEPLLIIEDLPFSDNKVDTGWYLIAKYPDKMLVRTPDRYVYSVYDPEIVEKLMDLNEGQEIPRHLVKYLEGAILSASYSQFVKEDFE